MTTSKKKGVGAIKGWGLGDLGSGSIILQLLKPSSFAPMLLALGMFIIIVLKKQNKQKSPDRQKVMDITGIMIGLGLLFYGMTMMEEVFEPLKDSPSFQKLFISFSNPLIGILPGSFSLP